MVYVGRCVSIILVAMTATTAQATGRVTQSFDFDWHFKLGEDVAYNKSFQGCRPDQTFPINMNNTRSSGLAGVPDAHTREECEAACCADPNCETWQFCPVGGVCQPSTQPCWIGMITLPLVNDTGWISSGRSSPFAPAGPPPPPRVQKCPQSPTCAAHDDSSWRKLNVPHDFIVEGTFTPDADRNHGYLPFNISWYRKEFTVDASWNGKSIWLDFDGVYRASDYWLNGVYLGHHESGYTPFRFYLHNATGALNYGPSMTNVLAVHVDALTFQEGWFYEGGGIYRHTRITAADPVQIVPWGVYAPSVIAPGATVYGGLTEAQTADSAIINIFTDVASALPTEEGNASYTLTTSITGEDGHIAGALTSRGVLTPGGWARISQRLTMNSKPPAAGFVVQLAVCEDSPAQQFMLGNGKIYTTAADGSKLCLDSGLATPGAAPMVVEECNTPKPTQQWKFESQDGTLPDRIVQDGKCLDVFGDVGPQLDLFPCNAGSTQAFLMLKNAIQDVSSQRCLSAVSALGNEPTVHGSSASRPQLWNVARPYLYTVTSVLTSTAAGNVTTTDTINTTIGIRSAVFAANQGFLLNGLPQKMKGLSMHQDFAGCGTAMPDAVNEFRVTSLKSMGATAWRTAHNPVNSEILDYTDKHGLLVWSENRNLERQVIGLASSPEATARSSSIRRAGFTDSDGNWVGASWRGVDPLYLDEAQAMVLRDRNHPSIVIWSLCNEGGCMQGDPDGGYVGSAFKNAIFDVDTSRPITANSEDTAGDTLTKVMDVNSFSYNYGEYDEFHIKFPFRTIIGGESASCVSDRSYYQPTSATTAHVNADDTSCVYSAWGGSAATRPWIVGNFAWTGFDYKGEPTPSNWPAINSHFGVIDIAGFPKDSYYYYAAWWRNDTSVLHILPMDWTAPVPVGTPIAPVVFSAGALVELVVNGQSLGKLPVPLYGVVRFPRVNFTPGALSATSWDAMGNKLASASVVTAKAAAKLVLTADVGGSAAGIKADGQDVALIRVAVVDSDGTVVPTADQDVTFTVQSGPGLIYGVGNGDPSDHDPDKASHRKVFKGLARVVLQNTGNAGSIVLQATAHGLSDGIITINAH